MTGTRLATGFWVAAKLRQIQSVGGYASILVKGNDEAGAINLVWRRRDGVLKLAVPAITSDSDDRRFAWRDGGFDEIELNAIMERELRFDRDQWFIECECSAIQFNDIFELKPI